MSDRCYRTTSVTVGPSPTIAKAAWQRWSTSRIFRRTGSARRSQGVKLRLVVDRAALVICSPTADYCTPWCTSASL
jgi:hypothetical protein